MLEFIHSYSEFAASYPFTDFAVRATIPPLFAAIALLFLHRCSAALRHRVWLLALTATLLLPLSEHVLPKWTLTFQQLDAGPAPELVAAAPSDVTFEDSEISTADRAAGGNELRNSATTEPNELTRVDQTSETNANADTAVPAKRWFDLHSSVVAIWLLGLGVGSFAFIAAAIKQWRFIKRLPLIEDLTWCNAVKSAAARLGLKGVIQTVVADEARTPATIGIIKPRLLVPRDWATWNEEQRACILLHELAHVQRRDVASQCLARVAVLIHWFNPLIWYAAKRMRAERELASDDCVLQTGVSASDYAQQLLLTFKHYRPLPLTGGVAMAHSARLDDRVHKILAPQVNRQPVSRLFSIIATLSILVICLGLSGVALSFTVSAPGDNKPPGEAPVWKENYAVEYPKALPVSVAFSQDGTKLTTGDTTGELMTLKLSAETPTYTWKSKVGGSHPAIAVSPDGRTVYATTTHGVVLLDSERGKEQGRIEEKDSRPIAIDVFPAKPVGDSDTWTQIAFGSARGYFVKTWVTGRKAGSGGTLETSTAAKDGSPADALAVPLAVDPSGRSAIMIGPIDGTGKVTGNKGKNVLWAYVCGDHGPGSPGNRVMVGHSARVVSAAWSQKGNVAVTGDASGRIIEWDTKTMKASTRNELSGRIAALAVSDDGKRIAAYVLAKTGSVYVWNAGQKIGDLNRIHTDLVDLSGNDVFASLDFSPDGKRLAGCAGSKSWLANSDSLVGKVRVWNLAPPPKKQPAPRLAYAKVNGEGTNFIAPNNNVVMASTSRKGSLNLYDVDDGTILAMMRISKQAIRKLALSFDRKWMAVATSETKDGLHEVLVLHSNTYPPRGKVGEVQQLLGLSRDGTVLAVIRKDNIELWDTILARKIKQAPFRHSQIDTAQFSPDDKWLVVSDGNSLIFWDWKRDNHARLEQGRQLESLAFSPDGRLLAEGPAHHADVRIRDVKSKKVIRTLSVGRRIKVPQLTFAQGGRILIACDKAVSKGQQGNRIAKPRVFVWDTIDGSLAHQINVPGLPQSLDVSPNELYLVARVSAPGGAQLMGWRLDGKTKKITRGPLAPATDAKR